MDVRVYGLGSAACGHVLGGCRIYGVPSDPKKIAVSRAIDRALTQYLADGGTYSHYTVVFCSYLP